MAASFPKRLPRVLETSKRNKTGRREIPSDIDALLSHGQSSNYRATLQTMLRKRHNPSRSSMDIVEYPGVRSRSRSHSPSSEPRQSHKQKLTRVLRRVSSASDVYHASESNIQVDRRSQTYRTRSPVGTRRHARNRRSG